MPKFSDDFFTEKEQKKKFKPKKYRAWTELDDDNNSQIKPESNQTQNEVKLESNMPIFSTFSPLSKLIIEYIYNRTNHDNKRETNEIKIDDIAKKCHTTISGAKVTVQRLTKKNYIIRTMFKAGKFGWSKYKICNEIYKQINSIKSTSQTRVNNETSVSIYNSSITNTIKNKVREIDAAKNHSIEQKDQLIAEMQKQIAELQKRHHQDDSTSSVIEKIAVDNDDLYEIDISPLEPFGFTQKHLKQVIAFNSKLDDRSKINADDLEESIQHYAWALENRFEEMTEKYGKSFANNKLKILMGVLKKGQSWTEPQFRSAEEIALEEQVKANKEKLKKLQALQEEAFNSAYELWKLELTKEQYTKIKDSLPSSYANLSDGSKMLVTALKNHFRENVYKG